MAVYSSNLERRRLGHAGRPLQDRLGLRAIRRLLRGLQHRRLQVPALGGARRQRAAAERRGTGGKGTVAELSWHQSHPLLWIRANPMVYDNMDQQLP
ncbi:xyloglucan endotransglucosylase/hydrolase 5 [Actinidia rufa]|uniref:Xyloglucan endotransglucosylase/hydrolase 5 n=1 Tax=Actinidia rufa TaxID=165716 RepID=A0A7J0GQ55_9ERIC|nr:xyloglucan endotransglucosylase/hydrolase 5 [Actinidia rufa]